MAIDIATRTITLNSLKGHISGDKSIVAPGDYEIEWRWGLIGLREMRLISREDGRFVATLTDRQSELEFTCS